MLKNTIININNGFKNNKNTEQIRNQIKTRSQKKVKRIPCLVKPKNELKTEKMRLDVLMGQVSGILSYDQKMNGKSPKYWNLFFQYFVHNLFVFDSLSIGLIG